MSTQMLSEEQEKVKALTNRRKSKKTPEGSLLCDNSELVPKTDKSDDNVGLEDYPTSPQAPEDETTDRNDIKQEDVILLLKKTKQVLNTGSADDDTQAYWDNIIAQLKATGEIDDDQTIVADNETLTDLSKDTFTLYELLRLKDTEIPFLVENILPERAINFLAGDSDVGKSLLYTQLATAIIEGKTDFLGLKLNAKHKRALIINSEDGPISIAVRVKKQLSGRLLSRDLSEKLTIITTGNESPKRISEILEKNQVDLVVLDAFADVFEDDLNSSNAVRRFLNKFLIIIHKFGCTVLFVHHTGKGKEAMAANKGHMLGSVGIHGKPRSVIMLSKLSTNPNIKTLLIAKSNHVGEKIKKAELFLEFDPVTLLHELVVDESLKEEIATQQKQTEKTGAKGRGKKDIEIQQACELRQEGKSDDEIAKIQGLARSTVWRRLKDYKPLYDVDEAI